jgi:hypothetical protein
MATAAGWPASAAPAARPAPPASAAERTAAALNWARCMRQHGVNVPDPQLTADGIVQQPLIPKSTKARAAERACRQYLRNGGQPAALTAQERQRALALARCVREHGISDMPDPQFTGNRLVQDGPPSMEDDDPRLTAARRPASSSCPLTSAAGVASEHAGATRGRPPRSTRTALGPTQRRRLDAAGAAPGWPRRIALGGSGETHSHWSAYVIR